MKSIIRLNKSDFVRCSNFLAGILNALLKIQLPAAESSTREFVQRWRAQDDNVAEKCIP